MRRNNCDLMAKNSKTFEEECGFSEHQERNEKKAFRKNIDHMDVEPGILYFGTPVVLISSLGRDGKVNLSPMSSAWALGHCVVLGLAMNGKTYENLESTRELTLNFPDRSMWESVERLAQLTGKNPVPPSKAGRYSFESDKFNVANLTEVESDIVHPPLVGECPIQMEATVQHIYSLSEDNLGAAIVEVSVVKIHADKDIILDMGHIDTLKWKPLIYSFRHYFSLGEQLGKTFKSET